MVSKRPVIPPMTAEKAPEKGEAADAPARASSKHADEEKCGGMGATLAGMKAKVVASVPAPAGKTRSAVLRLTHVDPWSVTKMSFLLSIVLGIVSVVAVTIVWGVLGAAGVWDSVNSTLSDTLGGSGSTFDITDYLGAGRVIGFTMLVAVVNVVLLTALATLAAFVYNLAATLLGGLELTLTEDR